MGALAPATIAGTSAARELVGVAVTDFSSSGGVHGSTCGSTSGAAVGVGCRIATVTASDESVDHYEIVLPSAPT